MSKAKAVILKVDEVKEIIHALIVLMSVETALGHKEDADVYQAMVTALIDRIGERK